MTLYVVQTTWPIGEKTLVEANTTGEAEDYVADAIAEYYDLPIQNVELNATEFVRKP